MEKRVNRFGTGDIYTDLDMFMFRPKKIYFHCTACMSIYADALSWVNAGENIGDITTDISKADVVILLSCQVTDLAVLNDLRTLDMFYREYPDKKYFIGGCLSYRFDIPLPFYCNRVEALRKDYQIIYDKDLVTFEKPFWVTDYNEDDDDYKDGHLFRDMYPMRVGVGCSGKCTYCTIRDTRGANYELSSKELLAEFVCNDDIVFITDSISKEQLVSLCSMADKHNKMVSFRNVEPHVANACSKELLNLASKGLLKVFHSPIQSINKKVLKEFGRSHVEVDKLLKLISNLMRFNVCSATNIITDYKDYDNDSDHAHVKSLFDYVSYNIYWDGIWDEAKAEERFDMYINS